MNLSPDADTITPRSPEGLGEFATWLVGRCFDPARPDEFDRVCSDEQARLTFAKVAQAFPDARLRLEWVVTDDRRAVLGGRLQGTHRGTWRGVPASGHRIDVAVVVVLVVVDGVVVSTQTVTDSLAMAEQLAAIVPLGPPLCQEMGEQAPGAGR
jgi:predicted ester cyclase